MKAILSLQFGLPVVYYLDTKIGGLQQPREFHGMSGLTDLSPNPNDLFLREGSWM